MKRSELHVGEQYLASRDVDWAVRLSGRFDRVLVVSTDPYRTDSPGRSFRSPKVRAVAFTLPDGRHLRGTVEGAPEAGGQGVVVLRVRQDTGLPFSDDYAFEVVPLSRLKMPWAQGIAAYEERQEHRKAVKKYADERAVLDELRRSGIQERLAQVVPGASNTVLWVPGHDKERASISLDTLERLITLASKA